MHTQFKFHIGTQVAALLLLSAIGEVQAQDVEALIRPQSSITVGGSAVSGDSSDRAVFGQYNGLRKHRSVIELDVDFLRRDEATGTWTALTGRNLGRETPELSFAQQRQGNWKYSFDYNEIVRNYSNTINTNLQGIGTNYLYVNSVGSPAVTATANPAGLAAAQGTGSNVDLKTTRKSATFAFETSLTPDLQFDASFKNEEKKGARIFGRGFNCSVGFGCSTNGVSLASYGALLLLPEPIDSVTRQLEMKLNYASEKLTLSGGYYGSFYINRFGSLNQKFMGNLWQPNGAGFDPTSAATGNQLQSAMGVPLALPPDNQSHQLSLAGTYAITPTTRATFKFVKTRGTQNESFADQGFGNSTGGLPRGSLDAVIDTTVAQAGLTSRPLPKLTVVANLRWETKSDKTPIDFYSPTAGHTNSWSSHEKINGKLEASYQLPDNYRATAGFDYDFRDLGRPTNTNETNGQANAMRAKTHELGFRGELRRSWAENLSGALTASHSYRNGSRWMVTNAGVYAPTSADGELAGNGATGSYNLFPLISMDLTRNKLKASTDWAPTERLSLQAAIDGSADYYYGPSWRGARDGKSSNVHIDAAYAISDNWKMNGWYSRSDSALHINGGYGGYFANQRQLGHMLGAGVRGAATSRLELGTDFTFSYEVNRTSLGGTPASDTANPSALPPAAFRQMNLNMYAKYAVDKNSDIKVNLAHQRYYSNEWFWNYNGVPFFYSDGTTVTQKDQQNVTFLGATYIYKFQ